MIQSDKADIIVNDTRFAYSPLYVNFVFYDDFLKGNLLFLSPMYNRRASSNQKPS